MRGLAWSRIAASTLRVSSASGSRAKNWSSASSLQMSRPSPWPRPPRPSPLLPERRDRAREAHRDRAVEQRRCRCRARARRWPRRRAARPRRAAARSPGAAPACSRLGTARVAAPCASSTRSAREAVDQLRGLPLFVKQIVRSPRETSPAISLDASPSALARRPSSASMSGGFQIAISRSACGAPSSLDHRRTARPSAPAPARPRWRSSPRRAGTAGRHRRARAIRRSRRRTFATCEPNTPR